ncbi:MAG: tripartite tricarboxylate transporter substrate binding protein [Xanthobacteraceae bacterium]
MRFPRRKFLHLAAGAIALPALSRAAFALDYPTRPVRILVGFPPGAATDIVARLLAQALSERLGQQFVVENKPGAASNLAAETVARAAPDGYTLLAMTVTNAVNTTLYAKTADFDFLHDIVPVASTIQSANVLEVNLGVPVKTVAEFVAYAKANPGKLNYASFGTGTAPNMSAELFKMMTGTNLVHVPYRSSFMPDLLSGQVQVAFTPIPLTIANIRAGRLRAIAVTSLKPSKALPDTPTVAATVPGYQASIWHGIGAPKGTPDDIVDKLHTAINAVLTDPAMKPKFANLGAEPAPMTRAAFNTYIDAEVVKWAKVIKFADIQPS